MAQINQQEAERRNQLAQEYQRMLLDRQKKLQASLIEEQRMLFDRNWQSGKIYRSMETALRNDPDLLPSEYVKKEMGWLFPKVINEQNRDVLLAYIDRVTEYPYATGYSRRSFRSRSYSSHAEQIGELIRSFLVGNLIHFPPPSDSRSGTA